VKPEREEEISRKEEEAMTDSSDRLRAQLAHILDWGEAHVGFDRAVKDIPLEMQGRKAPGFEHSPWQLLEHMRLAQEDILDFSVNAGYKEKQWPEEYWPKDPAPPDAGSWAASLSAFRADNEKLKQLARDPKIDLFAKIPHGSGQTYIREILLVADHNAYHIGQLVAARRALGIWT
jgi:uncharacterized damage-inducible protein DinB